VNLDFSLIIVSIVWLSSEIILTRIKHSHSADAHFDRLSIRRLWITIFVSVNAGVLIGLQRIGYVEPASRICPIAGMAFILLGLCIRWLAIISLKHQFTVDVSIRENHRLVKEGIYRFVRHPAYAGSLLSFFGLGLFFSNYLSLLIIAVPVCVAFLHRVHIEEEALVQAFGSEYLDYCASTKRFIPGVF
jgi:protein-S-isoprenylcysteine O-methyltransferase Ste14